MSLAEALAGKAPVVAITGRSRVHRIAKAREEPAPPRDPTVPVITPFLEPPPREDTMPKGKKAVAPATDAKPAKRTYTKRKAAPIKAKRAVGAARFVIDDRGGMSIEDGQQVIKIEKDDVHRLVKFLEHTKSIRA